MGAGGSKPPKSKPFIVLAELYTWSKNKTSIQLDLLKPVAEYELRQKKCGSYFFLLPVDGEQTTITLFESYDSRGYMFGSHKQSAQFQKMKELEAEHDIRSAKTLSYIITARGGFLERKVPSGVPVSEQFCRITKMTCDPKIRTEALDALSGLAKHLWSHANEALSYMVTADTEDPSALVLFERYPSEAIAEALWAHESSQSAMNKLHVLGVAQKSQDYRAVRGFLSKKEKLI